jgi:PAS domain S-box-containing protein
MRFGQLPRRTRIYISAVVLGGAAIVALRLIDARRWHAGDVAAWGVLALLTAASEQFQIQLKHRTETENFSLTDSVWAAALLLSRPSVLTLSVAAGILLGQLWQRWASVKVAFNVAQFVIAITAAQLVFGAFHLQATIGAATLFAAAVAMMAFFLLNSSLPAMVIALVEEERFRTVMTATFELDLLTWAGNLAVGMLAAILWERAAFSMPLLVVVLALSYLAYRAWLRGMRERDRMRDLYEASRVLTTPLEAPDDYSSFLQPVRRLLDAAEVELVLSDGGQMSVFGSNGALLLAPQGARDARSMVSDNHIPVRAGVRHHVALIGSGDGFRGALVVYRENELSASERSLVDALASQVSVRLENLRLFLETLEQRTQLEEIIAHSSDGIVLASQGGDIISWNPAMERITGFPPQEAIGRSWTSIIGASDEEGARLCSPAGPSTGDRDLEVVRKDGPRRWIRMSCNPIIDRDGTPKANVVVARDVTAELEAEHLKADFIATVSHELRTPLTPLKGFISSLIHGTIEDAPDTRMEYYRIMLNQANRLERLITDLLEVSRIESGTPLVDARPIELAALVTEQVHHFRDDHPGRDIQFDRPDREVMVQADPFRLGQVVTNLLSNALKYSPHNSPVHVGVAFDGERALVSVRDDGEGISPDEQNRVFERFHRLRNGLTRQTGGAGLGLYIAKRFVEAMAGQLWVVSSPGAGSTFSFALPLLDAGPAPDEVTAKRATLEGPRFARA